MQPDVSDPSARSLMPVEITLRSLILSIILTAVLAASNVYLALKLGHTIAASIPAAVLSLFILRFFKNSSILESNLVQTAASAGEGVAAAVSFILPALILTGYWSHFYYWETVVLVFLGGMLGLSFSIPLRRILINHPDLIFPEGTAIGHVLKASLSAKSHFVNLISGGLLGGLISLCQTGFKLISESWPLWFIHEKKLMGISLGFSPALLAAGFIVGMQACISMLIGLVICWVLGIPLLGLIYGIPPESSPYEAAMLLWNHHLRFVGVGAMLMGGVWTLLIMVKPIVQGLKVSWHYMSGLKGIDQDLPATDQDIPFKYVMVSILIFAILIMTCFLYYLGIAENDFPLPIRFALSLFATLFILFGGFFLASICAYLSGLVGMTNNPLSGLMLISVVTVSLLLSMSFLVTTHSTMDKITFVILITTLVAIISAISGENIQDLKAGQIVGATPWKQQIMIIIGVIVASFVVQPVLEILFQAYGIGGIFPKPMMDQTQMLPAPQAGLMTAVAQGVFGHDLPWTEVLMGALIALGGILIDEYIKKFNVRLPILAIGLGIYLPPEIIIPVVIGGFINYLVKRKAPRDGIENSTLLACGIVAGSALTGVLLAIPFVLIGSSDALQLVPYNFVPFANILGVIATLLLCFWLYRIAFRKSSVT
jgi:putative OPT family oligopeptide transporter